VRPRAAGAAQDVRQPVQDLLPPAGAYQLLAGGATRWPLSRTRWWLRGLRRLAG